MSATRTVLLVVSAAATIGCAEPTHSTTAPAVPAERSPEENEPIPAHPTAPTGALGAAALERAARIHADDPDGARTLLRAGCDQGTVRSCIALSEMLEAEGSAESLAEAAAVIEQACSAGSTDACDRMGH
ncbi:MAG: hypothetical protein AB8I08_01275 [Sandaracinaceae bacterium]